MGPKIAELNSAWASYCGTRRSVALANGTVTMELALRALGIGSEAEVIVPAWTFVATSIVVSQVGATVVFVDIEPDTLCISPDAVEAAISDRTVGVIPVHFGGHPCDMDRLMEVAGRHSLHVIEDAAQAHGAMWRGRRLGGFGTCGSYSFQQSKNLQCGEGGSLVTDDHELADRVHFSLSKFGRGTRDKYAPFDHYELAGNATMTEFQAAIVLAQLCRLDEQTDHRNRAAARLRELVRTIDGVEALPVDPRVDRHGCHLFLFRYDPFEFGGLPRDEFVAALQAEGIPCATLYPRPLFEERMYDAVRSRVHGTDVEFRTTDCIETRRAVREIVAIPQTVLLADDDELDLVGAAVRKIQAAVTSSGPPVRADR